MAALLETWEYNFKLFLSDFSRPSGEFDLESKERYSKKKRKLIQRNLCVYSRPHQVKVTWSKG